MIGKVHPDVAEIEMETPLADAPRKEERHPMEEERWRTQQL